MVQFVSCQGMHLNEERVKECFSDPEHHYGQGILQVRPAMFTCLADDRQQLHQQLHSLKTGCSC